MRPETEPTDRPTALTAPLPWAVTVDGTECYFRYELHRGLVSVVVGASVEFFGWIYSVKKNCELERGVRSDPRCWFRDPNTSAAVAYQPGQKVKNAKGKSFKVNADCTT